MKLIAELKRMKTITFWKQVGYWCALKSSGKKRQPISDEDWLPILTSFVIGVIILILIRFILH